MFGDISRSSLREFIKVRPWKAGGAILEPEKTETEKRIPMTDTHQL
jgi:hypothetical protein